MHDVARGGTDEAHAPHLGGELENAVRRTAGHVERAKAALAVAQVEKQELVRRGRRKLRELDVHAAHGPPVALEGADEMGADEAACSADECALHLGGVLRERGPFDVTRHIIQQTPPPAQPPSGGGV